MAVEDIIRQAAQQYGVSPEAMLAIAQLESSMNPAARNPRSSAGGLFQFIDSTARGYGLQDRFDPVQASDAAARLARDNANYLRAQLGREPTPGELYLAHQQGAGGAAKILRDPNARAVDVLGANQVRLNVPSGTDWQNMTAAQFANIWTDKLNRAMGSGARPSALNAINTAAPQVVPRRPQGIGFAPSPQRPGGISGLIAGLGNFAGNVAAGVQSAVPPRQDTINAFINQGVRNFWSNPDMRPTVSQGGAYPVQTVSNQGYGISGLDFGSTSTAWGEDPVERNIRMANSDAIRAVTGSGAITQDAINQALASGATLVRRI